MFNRNCSYHWNKWNKLSHQNKYQNFSHQIESYCWNKKILHQNKLFHQNKICLLDLRQHKSSHRKYKNISASWAKSLGPMKKKTNEWSGRAQGSASAAETRSPRASPAPPRESPIKRILNFVASLLRYADGCWLVKSHRMMLHSSISNVGRYQRKNLRKIYSISVWCHRGSFLAHGQR